MAITPNVILLPAIGIIAVVSSVTSLAHLVYDSLAISCCAFVDSDLVLIRREEYDGGRILDIY